MMPEYEKVVYESMKLVPDDELVRVSIKEFSKVARTLGPQLGYLLPSEYVLQSLSRRKS